MSRSIATHYFPQCLRAERDGVNTLIMRRLDKPIKRVDGKLARYELEHRWHSTAEADIHSVQGNDFTFWRESEIADFLRGKSLFECFQLF